MKYSIIKEIDELYGTPFYLMHSNIYRQNINNLRRSFLSHYTKLIIGYSYKTNYTPALCQIVKEEDCYAEVVSEMEYALALNIGCKPNQIIYNGPVKKQKCLFNAFKGNSIVNLESINQVDLAIKFKKMNPDHMLKVGLRINVEIYNLSGDSVIQGGLKVSRFGFTNEVLEQIIPKLLSNNIQIHSIHGHTSTSNRAINNYIVICDRLLNVIKHFQLNDVAYFNIGGGFFGASSEGMDIAGKPSYDEYAEAIANFLEKDSWFAKQQPYIVIEPGISLVANVFSFVSKIYQIKKVQKKHFITLDGSIYDVRPTMHNTRLAFEVYHKDEVVDEKIQADIVGSTCMEKDIILKDIALRKPSCGDYVCIHGVGAYTMVLTPTFINFLAPIISIEDNDFKLVRRRQTITDVLNLYSK